jgi:hypothetical protein
MGRWWHGLVCASCVVAFGCGDDECSAEQRVALEVIVGSAGPIDKVTVELEDEEECGTGRSSGASPSFSDPELVYTCWEQGGGVYTVRVYSGTEVYEEQIEIEADECHIKERASLYIDLAAPR